MNLRCKGLPRKGRRGRESVWAGGGFRSPAVNSTAGWTCRSELARLWVRATGPSPFQVENGMEMRLIDDSDGVESIHIRNDEGLWVI